METYFINSIDIKHCQKSKTSALKILKLYHSCGKVPLPSYRATDSNKFFYCKICYLKHVDPYMESLMPNEEYEMFLLGELIINCVTPNCDKEFNVYSLERFILHQNICAVKMKRLEHRLCKRCNTAYSSIKPHDCVNSLIKSSTGNLKTFLDEVLSQNNVLFNQKLDELSLGFFANEMNLLKNKITKLQQDNADYQLKINNLEQSILFLSQEITQAKTQSVSLHQDNSDRINNLQTCTDLLSQKANKFDGFMSKITYKYRQISKNLYLINSYSNLNLSCLKTRLNKIEENINPSLSKNSLSSLPIHCQEAKEGLTSLNIIHDYNILVNIK